MQIFTNGHIYQGRPDQWAEALVVDGAGMILAVGTQTDIQQRFPNAIREDLNGGFLFPGFIDGHTHPALLCREIRDPNLSNVKSWAQAQLHITEYIYAHPGREWYVIFGWNEELWGTLSTALLDTIQTDAALFIVHESYQKGAINSAGITLINKEDQKLDHENGIVSEQDFRRVQQHTFPSYDELLTLLPRFLRDLRKHGTTTIHDMLVMSIDQLRAYITLDQASLLPVEVVVFVHESLLTHPDIQSYLKYTGKHFTIAGIKIFSDGNLNEHTAHVHDAYTDGIKGHGIESTSIEVMQQIIEQAEALGLQDIAFHAIGDAAVTHAIDAVQQYIANHPSSHMRFRIDHAELIAPADIPRIKALHISVVMQPSYALDRFRFTDRLGERTKNINPFRALFDAGIIVAAGTENHMKRPFACIAESAKKDLTPIQKISIYEGVELYTTAGAILSRMDQFIGSLTAGKRADMMLLNENPFSRDVQLEKIKVLQTWFIGNPDFRQ
jgi:predicted amidohydrolase YtcJ